MTGAKWQYAATAAVLTLLASFGGGTIGLLYSSLTRGGHFDIMDLINGVLGALVSITGERDQNYFYLEFVKLMINFQLDAFCTERGRPF